MLQEIAAFQHLKLSVFQCRILFNKVKGIFFSFMHGGENEESSSTFL